MMMHERLSRFMERIAKSAQSSVIVTHANPAVAIIQWWLELPQEVMARVFFDIAFAVRPSSPSILGTRRPWQS